jgi:hypothetical protein
LLSELEELHMCVAGVDEEHATEAWELAALVVELSNTLVDCHTPVQRIELKFPFVCLGSHITHMVTHHGKIDAMFD